MKPYFESNEGNHQQQPQYNDQVEYEMNTHIFHMRQYETIVNLTQSMMIIIEWRDIERACIFEVSSCIVFLRVWTMFERACVYVYIHVDMRLELSCFKP